jgi:hypothetical protein
MSFVKMVGHSSTTSGGQQPYTICLTARPSAAGSAPPLLLSVTIHLLDLYHKCVDNSGWVRVLYKTHDSFLKLPLTYKFQCLLLLSSLQPTSMPAWTLTSQREEESRQHLPSARLSPIPRHCW